ncbi:MAG: hypothetical protein CMJ65_12110 [Planctomycetaceae bacterium]|nr:hypothetical protein [Planctomycetaceae bacterium]
MLEIHGPAPRLCDGTTRRDALKIGSLGVTGLTLPSLMSLSQASAAARAKKESSHSASFGKAKNCIVLFLSGGASQHDTFDPKPDQPAEIRGEFSPINTSLPGLTISEHLPRTSKWMDRVALIRSMTHDSPGHAGGGYYMFTGYKYPRGEGEANFMGRDEAPHIGAVVSQVAPGPGPMVPFCIVPRRLDAGSGRRAGQWGGSLGAKYDPLQTGGNPNEDNFKLEHLPLIANRPAAVIQRRKRLVDQFNSQVDYLQDNPLARTISQNQSKALDVITSQSVRRAVDLSTADKQVRRQYGRNLFGQSVLLGKRLLEAGTRLVQVSWLRTQGQMGYAWDSHWNNFQALREDLIPPMDVAFTALMEDLEREGRLDETLVVVTGEFGRTPNVTLKTAGREHWSNVFSVVLAGAGIRGGQVYGASDKIGGFPGDRPVTPGDLTATIYHCLGIDPQTEIIDQTGKPFFLSSGSPIAEIIG